MKTHISESFSDFTFPVSGTSEADDSNEIHTLERGFSLEQCVLIPSLPVCRSWISVKERSRLVLPAHSFENLRIRYN